MKYSLLQSSSSPRRVAVPVLVKDGKPCSGGGGGGQQGQSGGSSGGSSGGGGGALDGGGRPGQQSGACPVQQSQQCMGSGPGGLAMAYRQQGNYQQQCSTYLPLQARAW